MDAFIGGDLGVYSRYVWRGIQFDDKPVLQADLWVEVHGISMVFWGNMSLTDGDDEFEGQFNEWDVYISFPVESTEYLKFGGEIDYLSFPTSSGVAGVNTAEVSAWISAKIQTSPRIQIFWDVWQYHGIYAQISLSHELAFGPGQLTLDGGLGWGNDNHNIQAGVSGAGGLMDLLLITRYNVPISSTFSIMPGINFTSILNSEIRDDYEINEYESDNLSVFLNASIVY